MVPHLHLNPQIEHPERIKKGDKQMINELNYDGIAFPVMQKQYNKIELQNSIRINVFGYENGQPFPIHISKETFKDQMNLLLITKDEKKHYIFHNLQGYDSHFIMQQIGKIANTYAYKDKPLTINPIPNNMEKFMAFMLGNYIY